MILKKKLAFNIERKVLITKKGNLFSREREHFTQQKFQRLLCVKKSLFVAR